MYQQIRAESLRYNEHKDCAVVAVAIVCGVDYSTAHRAQQSAGRRSRRGTPMSVTQEALNRLGYRYEKIDLGGRSCKTVRGAERHPYLQQGKFLIRVSGHILAMADGKVEDYTQGRLYRVIEVFRVVPIRLLVTYDTLNDSVLKRIAEGKGNG